MRVPDDVQRRLRPVLGIYGGLGVALWPIPLFNLLHVESAAVVALAGFFVAGLSAVGWFEEGAPVRRVLGGHLAALVVPWALLTLTLLWVPNCDYATGLLFFVLFPVVSVVLAVALAYAVSGTRLRRKRLVFVLAGLGVAVLTPLYDLGLHPQFYVYNHVFGGILGPLYDEELAIRSGLFAFRALSLCWAGLLLVTGRTLRVRRGRLPDDGFPHGVVAGGLALLLGLGYLFAGPLGINTTGQVLQRALGGVYRTTHFDLYYDPASLTEDELARLAEVHEYRYARLAERLGVEVPERIASYLYPDPETKARLTGARRTNVAPVWLARPQTHVLLDEFEAVFPHELAHVFSRSFGLPGLRASLSVGLVEGFAVAMEPPDGLPTPHEQVLSAALRRTGGNPGALALAETLAPRLSPLGFWTGRSAVSYTTMGSFVRYLIDTYGAAAFRQVYARANFEAVYGKPARVLAQEWQAYLLAMPVVSRAAAPLAERRFAVPSLFEKVCPHHVPFHVRRTREGIQALARGDTAQALARLEAALARQPAYPPALDAWATLQLARRAAGTVVARLDTLAALPRLPALARHLGDAHTLLGDTARAKARYETALQALPSYAHEAAALVVIRKSLAPHPALVRILTSPDSAATQAARLATYRAAVPAAGILAALRWAESGRYEQAAALLRTTPPDRIPASTPARRALLRRQHQVWLAHLAHRAGHLQAAAETARQAARAFRAAGDLNAAARLADFADRVQWRATQPERVFAPTRGPFPETIPKKP
ncbi:MAG: hypothetical protein KatS3mg043_0956 [Rhodothermaceae bacterium]|nr:MAG: hypothetical protein KatS3mg043_0956 [Rhodothermaceae bacterium]